MEPRWCETGVNESRFFLWLLISTKENNKCWTKKEKQLSTSDECTILAFTVDVYD